MNRATQIKPEFVSRIPKTLSEGVLYISEKYSTAAHICCCGCGMKVITPLRPGRWKLVLKKGQVSLRPSIGNWSLACQSHYWISENRVEWERSYSSAEIEANRERDHGVILDARARRRKMEEAFWTRLWCRIKSWFL